MFKKILNIGTHSGLDFYLYREVKVLNSFALIIIFGLLVGSTNYFFLGSLYPSLIEILIALLAGTIILLNYYRKYEAAAYHFVILISVTLFFVSKYYPESTDTYLYYFPVIFCVALLHNPNRRSCRTFTFFTIILAAFFASRYVENPFEQMMQFTPEQIRLLRLYNVYFSIILTVVLVYTFIQMLNRKYVEITNLLELASKDKRIIANSLKEKEILLAEIQHRVKNNLAVITALFNFQKETASNEEIKQALNEAKNRVMSISMVHQQLSRKTNLSTINIKDYLAELSDELLRTYPSYMQSEIKRDIDETYMDISTAVPIGLIVNEVVTNSFKHGFKNSPSKPVINLTLQIQDKEALLTIHDNGEGFPSNGKPDTNSLGLTIVESLASQIDGKVTYENHNGARVSVRFPLN